MALFEWSKTAANNATADPDINWAEGQAPSTVNNSARAMMAEMAKWRDDISGTIVTGGSSTAYTVTTNSGLAGALEAGFMVAFIPHATNGGATTLNVDSSGALPLRGFTGVALDAGTLVLGTPYVAVLNAAETEWLLIGFRGRDIALPPLGALLPYTGSAAPSSNFVLPYGQAISRSTYAAYFALVGTTYGVGDGSTTFNVLDLRGRSIFGQDDMGGAAAGRVTTAGSGIDGTARGAVGGAQNVAIAQANLPAYTLPNTLAVAGDQTGGLTRNFDFAFGQVETGSGANRVNNILFDETTLSLSGSVTSGGSGTALNKMPPAIVLPFILRVL